MTLSRITHPVCSQGGEGASEGNPHPQQDIYESILTVLYEFYKNIIQHSKTLLIDSDRVKKFHF